MVDLVVSPVPIGPLGLGSILLGERDWVYWDWDRGLTMKIQKILKCCQMLKVSQIYSYSPDTLKFINMSIIF